jgi:signal transduction histidine kinase
MERIQANSIILILGMLAIILLFAVIRYARLSKQYANSLNLIREETKNEMLKVIQAEESKQNLEKALLHGQKLQAIGTLAGGIAHDFNNILYAIKGYLEIARDDLQAGSLSYQNLSKALDASARGQELISHILTFSRKQHISYQPIELCSTIKNVLVLLKPSIPAAMTLHFESDLKELFITGNQTQLYQIIVNIVNNAVDAISDAGTITIRLTTLSPDDKLREQLPAGAEHHFCRIDICDTGQGMSESTLERMFEPFYTTKEVGKGTGLGLSTVHAIVKEYKGIMAVDSQLGQGTTFTLLLPMLTNEQPVQGGQYGKNFTR